jgi:hypothetical protein
MEMLEGAVVYTAGLCLYYILHACVIKAIKGTAWISDLEVCIVNCMCILQKLYSS